MPIRPENLARYPADWKEIRERILFRAGNRCEGSPAFPNCDVPNGHFRNNVTGDVSAWEPCTSDSYTRIVLTIGHLDHTPENCADDNLRAWCQRCHLTYDAKHHAQTAYATRKARANTEDMFA